MGRTNTASRVHARGNSDPVPMMPPLPAAAQLPARRSSGAVAVSDRVIDADLLSSCIARLENIEAQIRELNALKSGVFKELKAGDLNVLVVRLLMKEQRSDRAVLEEREQLKALYAQVLRATVIDGSSQEEQVA